MARKKLVHLLPFSGEKLLYWVHSVASSSRLLTPVFLGFPCGSAGKESTCNVGNLSLIPGTGEFHGLYSPWGRRVRHDRTTFTFTSIYQARILKWVAISASGLPNPEIELCFPHLLDCRWILYH